MNVLPYSIAYINRLLLATLPTVNDISVGKGETGISVYFFHLYRLTGDKEFERLAESLLEHSTGIINRHMPLGISDGLTGIGCCFEYLAERNFIDAEPDELLEEVDDYLQCILYAKNIPFNLLVDICIYYCKRLQKKPLETEDLKVLKLRHHVIYAIDVMWRYLKEIDIISFFKQGKAFDIFWQYPLFLSVLSRLYGLDLYNHKVCKLLNLCLEKFSEIIGKDLHSGNCLSLLVELYELQSRLIGESRIIIDWNTTLEIIERHVHEEQVCCSDELMENAYLLWHYKQLKVLTGRGDREIRLIAHQIEAQLFSQLPHLSCGLSGMAGVGLSLLFDQDVFFDYDK